MESLDYWRLCDQLSVSQAALLIVGKDPATVGTLLEDEPWSMPNGFLAARSALENAVASNIVQASIMRRCYSSPLTAPPFGAEDLMDDLAEVQELDALPIDWAATRLDVESLKKWLLAKGFTQGFFFPAGVPKAEYLNEGHPSYAPKLAAAVKAWEALQADSALFKGRSPKQALIRWLNQHASELGLSDDEGKPISKAVEDIATVANWNTVGGAPKTPSNMEAKIVEPDPRF